MREPEVPTPVRVLSAMLTLGALWGVVVPLASVLLVARLRSALFASSPLIWILSAAALVPFAWCFWLGYHLWNGKRWALNCAKWTFLLQVLQLAFPGFSYQFDIFGVTVGISSAQHWHVLFTFGCDFAPIYAPANHDVIIGLNVVAVIAANYLFKITAPGYREPQPGDNFGLI